MMRFEILSAVGPFLSPIYLVGLLPYLIRLSSVQIKFFFMVVSLNCQDCFGFIHELTGF